MHSRFFMPTIALATTALLVLSGCASSDSSAEPTDTTPDLAGDAVTIDDAWVKAADSGMSAAFGDLKNTGTEDITLVSASTPASSLLELHETAESASGSMAMRQKDGGFTIPAGGQLTLEPGGNHIMLMGLHSPVQAGDELTFTLTFSDESTFEFTAPAKDYAGANENYEDGEMDMSGMDHSGADHSDPDMGEK